MIKTYLISTPYHLLISIIKTILANRIAQDELIIIDKRFIQHHFLQNAHTIFKKITIINQHPTVSYLHILLWRNRISRRIPFLYNMLKKYTTIDEAYFKNKEVYMFYDLTYLACLLNVSKIEYNLIEDGLNQFQQSSNSDTRRRSSFSFLWDSILGVSWKAFGQSKLNKSIEVNDGKNLHIKHPNIIVANRAKFFRSLTQENIDMIAKIFDYQPIGYQISEESTLLLTQPLVEDKLLSQSKKNALYKYLVKKYAIGKLYIKVHPREKEDYTKIFPNAVILGNRNIPFELLLLKENFHFKRAITAFSTAIDAVFCADEKINMGQEWTLNFQEND